MLAERGIAVSYESIRLSCNEFGLKYVRRLKKKHQGFGDTFFIDEVFVKIDGKQHYLWNSPGLTDISPQFSRSTVCVVFDCLQNNPVTSQAVLADRSG